MTQTESTTKGHTETAQITSFTIEHLVVPSQRDYDQTIQALEAQVGIPGDWEVLPYQLAAMHASWEQVTQLTQPLIGTSGFTTFVKMEQGLVLSLTGKQKRLAQYSLGNHLIGVYMIEQIVEVGLYAPPRVLVYEDYTGKVFVAYDRLTSLVAQYQNEEVTQIARLVDQKLDELVKAATGYTRETLSGVGPGAPQ